jgi:hypothetical protein
MLWVIKAIKEEIQSYHGFKYIIILHKFLMISKKAAKSIYYIQY